MANAGFNDETTINANLFNPSTLNASLGSNDTTSVNLPPINYIPGYKIAEEERRANEVVRQENETQRIALYEDMENKLETGYFDGADGVSLEYVWDGTSLGIKRDDETEYTYVDLKGEQGETGATGEKGDKGDKGDTGAAGHNGRGIVSITVDSTVGRAVVYKILYTDNTTSTFTVYNGANGQDGYSPSASVSKVSGTATITITDKNGTTTASITDGIDGQDGQDGFSPTATVTKSGDTATISITDKNGTTTETVSDGADGTDGTDGYSPTATVSKSGKVATITITDINGTTTAEIRDGEDGQGSGDMLKATYDTNDNGIVDNAEKVNNHTVLTDVPANAIFTDTTYTAGTNVSISSGNVISATDTTYTAGTGIDITNGVISNTQTSAEWGNITGTLSSQTDLNTALGNKVDKVTGKGLSTEDYTTTEKTKLGGIETGAEVNDIDIIKVNGTAQTITNKAVDITVPTTASDVGAVPTSSVGTASGVAELDANGKVPSSQLPSYVDDVIEGYYKVADGKFYKESTYTTEIPGETGKIYISIDTNKSYRWTGSGFAEISSSLALGETSSTAYRGDRGKTAYDHSQLTSGNPHNVSKSDVGLGNVGNFKAVSTEASQGLSSTEQSNARANISAVGTSDYAVNGGAAGIIKVGDTYGGKVDASGNLYARQLNYIDYVGANDNIFVSKGTLKAVLIGKGYTTPEVSIGTTTPTGDEVLWINPNEAVPVQGSYISNSYGTSTEIGYSQKYVNEHCDGMLLWTNSNPTSNFNAQDITLSSSDYDMYEIVWRRDATSTNYGYMFNTGKIPYNMIATTGKQILFNGDALREYSVSSKTTFSFSSGKNSGTTDNKYAVPLYIIGYKTGIFS